jgi:endonuclease/exonuclease/phosphatase (EEP) superfamily protein YafD
MLILQSARLSVHIMKFWDWLQPVGFLRIITLCFLVWMSISGCAFTPEQEQFVSAGFGEKLTRSSGNCQESTLFEGGQKEVPSPVGLDPARIALLDWNIYKERRVGWERDFLRFSSEKDIIVLQEASLTEDLLQLFKAKQLYWNFNSAFRYKGVETGVLTAARLKPHGSCGMRYNEPVIIFPKTIIVSRFPISGSREQLLVANVHGINITLGIEAYQKQFDALLAVLQKHKGPLVLVGDFNNWNDKRTGVVDLLAEKLSLRVLAFGDGGRTRFFDKPVDHVLFRGLEPVAHTVHSVTSSDHNPISVTFRLGLL